MTAGTRRQNRRGFDIPKQLCHQSGRLFASLLLPKRQVERTAEDKPMPLIIRGKTSFRANSVWVLGLRIEIGSVIDRLRQRVAARKFNLICPAAIHGNGGAVVGRAGIVLPFVDVVKNGIQPARPKHEPAKLLRRNGTEPER